MYSSYSSPTAKKIKGHATVFFCICLLLVFLPAWALALTESAFLYKLSDFTGAIPFDLTRVSIDGEKNEIYVLHQNSVRVFNDRGMEIYRFGDDLALGQLLDVAVEPGGNILLLSHVLIDGEPRGSISLCNFRGEPLAKVELKNLPPRLAGFVPNHMVYRNGDLYLFSGTDLVVVVADARGNFKKQYDLFSLLELTEKDRGNVEITGFSVDGGGNILFTTAVQFRAHILRPDGKLSSFGKPGGAPGNFNVIAGIAADSKGNVLVADKLKSAVLVFDSNFNFVTQFGYRGPKPGNLLVPDTIVVDGQDRIYVTQAGRRGVSVFRLTDS